MESDKPKILLVDDEAEFLKLLKVVLIENGYIPILANSGKEALEKLNSESDISVIMADHKMPGISGIDLFEKTKRSNPNITRIIMTAYQNAEMMEDSINKAEVYKFLTKPIEIDKVLEAIKMAVDRHQTRIRENRNKENF